MYQRCQMTGKREIIVIKLNKLVYKLQTDSFVWAICQEVFIVEVYSVKASNVRMKWRGKGDF